MKNLLLFPIDGDDTPDAESEKTRRSKKARSAPKHRRARADATNHSQRLLDQLDEPAGLPGEASEAGGKASPDLVPRTGESVSHSEPAAHSSVSVSAEPDWLPTLENTLIRASAGTGKTYQLTSRYLRLLLLGAEPETILATTFTRKAAGEILDRIVMWLARAANDADELSNLARAVELPRLSHDECRSKLRLLTRRMHRLRIHTIDAFFMQMALTFSLELGMTPGWQVLEEGGPESSILRNDAIAGVLRQESLEDLLVLVHQLSPKGEAKRSLDGMLKSRVNDAYRLFLHSSADAWDQLDVPAPLTQEELDDVRETLRSFTDKRSTVIRAINADVRRITDEDWRGFFDSGTTLVRSINEGKEKYGNARITPELLAVYRRFLPHLRAMILRSARAQTMGTRQFLEKYHRQYRAAKDRQRLYSFDEITALLARHAQGEGLTGFTFRMDAGVDHLLLDEFQDTSITQWRALTRLAERCASGEPNRSFFCVGDVKQAIYGWRGGSSEIFDVLDQRFANLQNLELKESRRSSQIIIDAVNQVFDFLPTWDAQRLGRAKRAAADWKFSKHSTYLRSLPGYFTIETSDVGTNDKFSQEEVTLRRAAERVAAMRKQAPGRTIGVLCRRNDKVGQMMNWLQRLGVPASEEGGNLLTDSAAVELILSLLQLTDHPQDSIAAFHLATSPWGSMLGLKPNPLHRNPERADDDAAKDTRAAGRLAGIHPNAINTLVRTVRRHLLESGFGDTIQNWAEQLSTFCNRREARRLTQLVEQAYAYQSNVQTPSQLGYERQRRRSIRPTEFVRFIRETKVTDPSNATVRVMTVHQAKGLEFDIVILPDLLGPFVDGHDTFLYRRPTIESDIDLVFRYMGKDSGRSFLPNECLPLFDDFEDRKARESFCVLYVAMTRAVHALHVFLPEGMQKLRMPKGHPGYLIKDAFAPGIALEPMATLYEAGDKHWFLNDPKFQPPLDDQVVATPEPRLAKSKPQRRGFEVVAPSQIGSNRYVRLSDRLAQKSDSSRAYGNLIHLWLSQIEWINSPISTPGKQESSDLPAMNAIADAPWLGMAEPYADRVAVNDALHRFRKMLDSEPLVDILDYEKYRADLPKALPNLPADFNLEVRLEQPVAGRDGDRIIAGTIDRLVLVRAGGKLVAAEIIDYKTNNQETQPAENFARTTDQYEMQMAAYRRVLAASLRITDVTSRLVFL